MGCNIYPYSCDRVQLAHEALERTTFPDKSWEKAVYVTCQSCDHNIGSKEVK